MPRLKMRPPASPSCRLYEPEAIGAYAYAPAGIRKERREQVKGEGERVHLIMVLSYIDFADTK